MMAQQAAPRIKMLNIVGLKMVWATRDKFSPATCSTGSTPAATMDISAYTTATVRQMSRIPMGIVLRGFLVAGMTETGAMVVPWQAKDIMAMAPIRPPKPPEKNWPSALEKYPGCTWGRPAAKNTTMEISSEAVIIVVMVAIALVPLMDMAKKITISRAAIQS